MATSVSVGDVSGYIQTTGYECSEFIIQNSLVLIDEKDSCFDDNGYSDERVKLIKTYLAALMCISGGAERVKTERDLSGDSITFENKGDIQGQLASAIRQLDTAGCVDELISSTKGVYLRTVGCILS